MSWDREKEKKAGKAMTIGSCVFGLVFSIFWCIAAASMGAGFMLIFGIPFSIMMAYRLYVCIQLTKKDDKPAEPWDRPQSPAPRQDTPSTSGSKFCPYCGSGVEEAFEFCPCCGRRQS